MNEATEQPELSPKDLVAAIAEKADTKLSRVELSYSWLDGEFGVAAVVHLKETTGFGKHKVLFPRGLTAAELLADLDRDLLRMKMTP